MLGFTSSGVRPVKVGGGIDRVEIVVLGFTSSGVSPVKANMPIWLTTCDQSRVEPACAQG